MEYRTLGKSDLRVSRLGLGTWQFGESRWGWGSTVTEEDAHQILQTAFDAGLNFIDTAEAYGRGISEQVVGNFCKKVARENLIIATKVSGQHLRHGDVIEAAEASLSRLGISTIDLYQVHFPNPYVPLNQTMKAMEQLVERGVIRYIGLSNFSKPLIKDAQAALSNHEIISNQVRYNLLQRGIEDEILPYCQEQRIAIIAFSPLAQGLLTGKFEKPDLPVQDLRTDNPLFNPVNTERLSRIVEVLKQVARRYDKTPGQVALNWLLSEDDVFPIPGAKSSSQLAENVGAAGWRLKPEDVALLAQTSKQVEISYFV